MTTLLKRKSIGGKDYIVYIDTALDALRAFIETRILKRYNGEFKIFLIKNLHYFYHQNKIIKCCKCTSDSITIPKIPKMSTKTFAQLYCPSGKVKPDHLVEKNGSLDQECLHQFKEKEIELDQLDIETLCFLLSHKGDLTQKEDTAVQQIKCLVGTMYDNNHVDTKELCKALEEIIYSQYYRRIVVRLLNGVQKDVDVEQQKTGNTFNKDCDTISDSEKTANFLKDILKSVPNPNFFSTISKENYSLAKPVKPAQDISIGNLKFRLHDEVHKNEGFHGIVQNKSEYHTPSSDIKAHTVIWKLDIPKEWDLDKIKAKLSKTETYANNRVRIKAIKRGSLIVESTVEDHVLRNKWDETPKLFLQEVVKIGEIDTNEECTIEVTTKIIYPETDDSVSQSVTVSMGIPINSFIMSSILQYGQRSQRPYPGSVLCDSIFIDCIVSKDLEHGRFQETKEKEVIKSTDAFKKLISLQTFVQHNKDTTEDFIQKLLLTVIQTYDELAVRYALVYSKTLIDNVDILVTLLNHAITLEKTNCGKAIAWEITRRFSKTVLISQYHDIWPAFRCVCKTNKTLEDVSCSANTSNIVIVAEVHKGKSVLPKIDYFHGIQIIYKEVNGQSKEAMRIVERVDGLEVANTPLSTIQGVSSEDAKKYFAKHSKLSLFSKSHLKSKGFGHKNSILQSIQCIQLFCRAKGFIPIGESHFPLQIASIKTDILEGYPQLMANNIRIGSTLFVPTEHEQSNEQNRHVNDQNGQARSNNPHGDEQMDINNEEEPCDGREGTVGGFIKYHGEDAFLTCAHVVLNQKCLVSGKFRTALHDNPVKVYCRHDDYLRNTFPCGQLACFAFPPEAGMGSSIDAAIIKIDHLNASSYIDENEKRELKSKYLHQCCLDWREVGVYHNMEVHVVGSVSKLQNTVDAIKTIDERNVKFETLYQAVSKVYHDIKPAHLQDSAHFADQAVKTVSDRQSQNPGNVIFLNQIAMHKLKFEQGDSGMCIYVRNRDGKLWCIGMAIATHPAGGCIITPLNAILKHFNY